jgi:hypothetical protein
MAPERKGREPGAKRTRYHIRRDRTEANHHGLIRLTSALPTCRAPTLFRVLAKRVEEGKRQDLTLIFDPDFLT